MINLKIPDMIEVALKLPEKKREEELLKLLAIKLYEKGVIGIGKASELCRVNKMEFMHLLKEDNISLNYDDEELERDLRNMEHFRCS